MAGQLEKDVKLIFRGEDRASPTIKGVRDSVSDLTQAIRDQLAAAERGEGSIDDLTKAYKQLTAAQADVADITKLAVAYENLSTKQAEAAQKTEELRKAEAALNAQVEAATAPTKRLVAQRDAATRAVAAAAQREADLANQVKLAGEAFEQAGGDTKNFTASQQAIRQAAIETATAINQATQALDNYNAMARQGASNRAKLDEAIQFNAAAASSGLPEAQIKFISTLENRIQVLSQAMKENTASAAAMNREIADRSAAEAEQRVRAMAAALDEADQAQKRLAAAQGIKQMAREIETSARDMARFGTATDTAGQSASRLANSIQAIITPTQAAARTLDGVLAQITAVEQVIGSKSRKTMSELQDQTNSLSAATAGLIAQARDIDAFKNQQAAVAAASAAFDQAQADVLQYANAIQTVDEPTDEMVRSLKAAESVLEQTGTELQRETTRLKQLEGALESAKIDVNNLATAEIALSNAAQRAASAQAFLHQKTRGRGFLGLDPLAMQNIGFQINDIVVGLASGQKPLTVFIQQGAQLGQIIPGAFQAIASKLPLLAGIGIVLAPIIAAFIKVGQESKNLETAGLAIQSIGNAARGISTQGLADVAEAIRKVGIEAEEARKLLRGFVADGLSTAQMEDFIETARVLSKVTGIEIPDAIELLRGVMNGGMEAVLELQEATGALTQEQLDNIQAQFDAGEADEARIRTLEILYGKHADLAAGMDGPWTKAVKNLGDAWNRFVNFLSNTGPIDAIRQKLHNLGVLAAYVTARLAGKTVEEATRDATGAQQGATRLLASTPDPNRQTAGGQRAIREERQRLDEAKAVTAEEKRALAVRKAKNNAIGQGATRLEAENAARLAGAAFDAQEAQRQDKRDAAAGRRADAAAKRNARAAETQARQIAAMEEQLLRSMESLDQKVANTQTESLEDRLNAVDDEYAKLFRSIDEFEKKAGRRGKIGDKTLDQARAHIALQKEILRNSAQQEFAEEQLNALLQERSEKLAAIDDKVSRGIITPEEGLAESERVINDIAAKVEKMAADALAFAISLRGATPNAQLEAFIAKMQTAVQNNQAGQNVRAMDDRRKSAVSGAENQLNDVLAKRNALVEHENLLVTLGLQTRRQAQQNIEQHFQTTAPLIQKQVDLIRSLAAAFSTSADPAMRLFFEALMANLNAVELQMEPVNENFVQLKQGFDQLFTSNIIEFIREVAMAFADLATGQGDVMDFIESIGRAFLSMIAKTLEGIAMLILQILILQAIDKLTGGLVTALLKVYGSFPKLHGGGIVGQPSNRSGNVSPLVFAGAPRYHNGGIAGLAPNERAAILKKNEEVLTENDPRHIWNMGKGSGQDNNSIKALRNVLVLGERELAAALTGPEGEEVVLTHIRANKTGIKQMLDN